MVKLLIMSLKSVQPRIFANLIHQVFDADLTLFVLCTVAFKPVPNACRFCI